jgi:hypothetical protein
MRKQEVAEAKAAKKGNGKGNGQPKQLEATNV